MGLPLPPARPRDDHVSRWEVWTFFFFVLGLQTEPRYPELKIKCSSPPGRAAAAHGGVANKQQTGSIAGRLWVQ